MDTYIPSSLCSKACLWSLHQISFKYLSNRAPKACQIVSSSKNKKYQKASLTIGLQIFGKLAMMESYSSTFYSIKKIVRLFRQTVCFMSERYHDEVLS